MVGNPLNVHVDTMHAVKNVLIEITLFITLKKKLRVLDKDPVLVSGVGASVQS